MTAIIATAITPAPLPQAATIRSIVLNPGRYVDQKVAITGQYSGRNLLGDLPDAPAKSRYDFALRSADAALWVINMRPKLKDASGKDIELGLDARIDTGRWLNVRGTIRQGRGLIWLDAEAGSLAFAKPPTRNDRRGTDSRAGRAAARSRLQRADAGRNRRLDGDDHPDPVLARYRPGDAEGKDSRAVLRRRAPRGRTGSVDRLHVPVRAARIASLELKFTKPLERFRTVNIELLEGILGTDGQPLKPWTLTFSIGGS